MLVLIYKNNLDHLLIYYFIANISRIIVSSKSFLVKIDFFYCPIAKFCLAVSNKRNNFASENN